MNKQLTPLFYFQCLLMTLQKLDMFNSNKLHCNWECFTCDYCFIIVKLKVVLLSR